MVSLSDLRLRAARARIAAAVLSARWPATLGSITLAGHQRWIATRAARAIARDGGCLIAEEVGRGKTYVALALTRGCARPLVVAPASLRETWADAVRRAEVRCAIVSHEALSRGGAQIDEAAGPPDLVIVDESHRFRSTAAKRYGALARLAAHTPVVLLSATPLQNSRRDLQAQLALFLGARAFHLRDDELARWVVRGGSTSAPHRAGALPALAPPTWIDVGVDDGAVLRDIVALPAPPRAVDAGDAGVLRTLSLVRAWASSRAALAATLRRRERVLAAIEQSLECGLVPSRKELRSWRGTGSDVQLGFPTLLVETSADEATLEMLRASAIAERAALARLARRMAATADPDAARVAALRALRGAHPGARILAFSERAGTVRAFYAALRADDGVALLTAGESRIASGAISRRDLLARFAPRAQGAGDPPLRERITFLLATDLLSEGMNLQDASVVVHLDLPWNPMRLAQRVGRVRRPGGASVVHSYLLAPPAGAHLLLRVEQRLRGKLARAERAIGRMPGVLPALSPAAARDLAAAHEALSDAAPILDAASLGEAIDRVAAWHRPSRPRHGAARTLVAAAESVGCGWLAALDDGRLIAALDGAPADDHASLPEAVRRADGAARPVDPGEAQAVRAAAHAFIDTERTARLCGVAGEPRALQQTLSRTIAAALRTAPFHERAALASRAAHVRDAWTAAHPLGAEWELAALLAQGPHATGQLGAWLDALAATARMARTAREGERTLDVVALVMLGPRTASR